MAEKKWLQTKMYDKMTDEQKQEFWTKLNEAMYWRGWDKRRPNHSTDFIDYVENQAREFGFEIMEYT